MVDQKYTVLIVDDMPENVQVISSILYERGVNIAIAQCGGEALGIARKKNPDLVLLDILMADMDGYEVCRQLKQTPETQGIPVIFLTGKAQPEDIVNGFECGAVDYITKPFNPAELRSRVFTHLELKRSRDIISAQNQQLADQNQQLHELNATKDKFFSIIAHDLKNPFNALLSLSSLLYEELRNYALEDIERYIKRIYQAADRSYVLLENLLGWARSQTGRIQFSPFKIHLKTLINETLCVLENHAGNKDISFVCEVSDSLSVVADAKMLSAILRNIISNAVKFTEPGGKVTVRVQERDHEVEIAVIDTGVGISAAHLKNLFRLDVHHATLGTAEETGSGLGLILCKEFIDRHGGTIRVESEQGKGSQFLITLPKGEVTEVS